MVGIFLKSNSILREMDQFDESDNDIESEDGVLQIRLKDWVKVLQVVTVWLPGNWLLGKENVWGPHYTRCET